MLEITAAEITDAEEIIALQRLAYQSEAELYHDWNLPPLIQTVASLKQEFEMSFILKAIINNQIIGSVRAKVEGDICKIGRLIVHPAFQKQGIGSKLLERLERLHPSQSCFELFTGSKSMGNIRFYKRHGYRVSSTARLSEAVEIIFLTKPTN